MSWAAVLALVLTLACWADRPASRYQDHPEHYRLIFGQTGPVDVVVLGSSRAMTAVDADRLARGLSGSWGRPVTVLDLSKKWLGNGVTYVMLRDLLKHRGARQIVVEFKHTGSRANPLFYQVARWPDVLESGLAATDRAWPIRLQEILDTAVRKITRQPTLWLTGQRRVLDAAVVPAATGDASPHYPVHSVTVKQKQALLGPAWPGTPDLSWPLNLPEEARNLHYLEKILTLAGDSGSRVVFVNFPGLYDPPLSDAFGDAVQQAFGVPLLRMTRSQLEPLFRWGFADSYHANRFGAGLVSDWLAGALPKP